MYCYRYCHSAVLPLVDNMSVKAKACCLCPRDSDAHTVAYEGV